MIKIFLVAMLMLLPISSATVVEVDNYMPQVYNYCYNAQLHEENPLDPNPIYRLELLTSAYSTNGRISGLENGFRLRTGIDCNTIEFVDKWVDWTPIN